MLPCYKYHHQPPSPPPPPPVSPGIYPSAACIQNQIQDGAPGKEGAGESAPCDEGGEVEAAAPAHGSDNGEGGSLQPLLNAAPNPDDRRCEGSAVGEGGEEPEMERDRSQGTSCLETQVNGLFGEP